MRIQETKVFTFDELEDRAKEKARDWYREGALDYDWYEFIYDDAATIADILGINLRTKSVKLMNGQTRLDPCIWFSGFSSQGDGACFEGSYRYAKSAPAKIREHAPNDTEFHRIADELQALQKKHFYRLSANVSHNDRYYHKYSVTVEVMDGEDYAKEETEETLKELLRDFMEWIYRALEAEHDFQLSNEAVDDTIRANEYEFTIDGERA